MALRSLCSLRLKTVVEYVVPCLERGLVDQSAYVRRNAIMGVLKLYHIEKDRVRESNLVTALQNLVLDEDALVRVLKEPRNSLVKQYKELLSMDSVELEFTDEALHAIARKTIERKTGARGLRSVMEGILLPVMYDVPNDPTIIRVTIDKDTVEGGEAHLEYGAVRKRYKNQTALS